MSRTIERSVAVTNAAESLGFKFALFAILADVIYRSWKLNDASWDLFAIVISSSLVAVIYQVRHKAFTKSWIKTVIISLLLSVSISVIAMAIILTTKQ